MTTRAGAGWSGTFSSALGCKSFLYSCPTLLALALSCSVHRISHFLVLLNVSGTLQYSLMFLVT